ncbi:MAG: hypothetical protein HYZ36_06310, partial [Pedosphaera parvula]|nr:hypothetical protein [Pedosphaera parvula]
MIERVVERGPHHKEIETTREVLDKEGKLVTKVARYILLQNGLHYQNEQGEWVESQELIQAHPDGATAIHGPHKVIFSSHLLDERGTVDILTPDGKRIRASVLGLAWTDTRTGKMEWIALAKDTVGVIQPPNRVVYASAFDGIEAELQYTYRTGSLEADVILRASPRLPEGIDPANARLQVVTEFLEVPEHKVDSFVLREEINPAVRAALAQPDFADAII